MVREPVRERHEQSHAIAAASMTAAIPASHRMPGGQAAQRFNIRKR
jgi:hypothetical protein